LKPNRNPTINEAGKNMISLIKDRKFGSMFRRLPKNYFACILCGFKQPQQGLVEKEASNCSFCGATWRDRAVILLLSRGLRTPELPFTKWRSDFSRVGVGFDDGPVLGSLLPTKLRYVNTHITEFPVLDLTRPDPSSLGFFEFALCTEVLEHVTGDPAVALTGLYRILRPSGFAVVTVPVASSHQEWYPNLLEVLEQSNQHVKWKDADGHEFIHNSPEYHGGTGDVLSFRVFSMSSVRELLVNAGFTSVEELMFNPRLGVPSIPEHGVFLARK
jgi:SAM-dependent methyltransferase